MDDQRIARWRLRTLRLSGPAMDSPQASLGWLCAVQSQDFGPGKWSLAMRTTGATDDAMDRLVADGAILRTHVLRPTWHFVLPDDIRWLLELTSPRIHTLNGFQYRSLGLDATIRDKAADLLGEALAGGEHLTRKQVGALWERAGIEVDGQRLPYLLMHAELEQVVCSGRLNGRQQTYALLEERAPHARVLAREEGLAELTYRYFASHGPATERDFQAWSSLTLAEIREGLGLVGSDLDRLDVGERTYWFAEPPPARRPTRPTALLLQGYDELVMGYRDSRWVIDVAGRAVEPRRKTVSNGIVVVDGQVAGHWKRTPRARTVRVEVGLYAPLSTGQTAALAAEADRYGQFLGLSASVVTTSA